MSIADGLRRSGLTADAIYKRTLGNAEAELEQERWREGSLLRQEAAGQQRARFNQEQDAVFLKEAQGLGNGLFTTPLEDGGERALTGQEIMADPRRSEDLDRLMKTKYTSKRHLNGFDFVRLQDMGDGTQTMIVKNAEGKEFPLTKRGLSDPNDPEYNNDEVRVFRGEELDGFLGALRHDLQRDVRNTLQGAVDVYGEGSEVGSKPAPGYESETAAFLRRGEVPPAEGEAPAETTGLGGAAPTTAAPRASGLGGAPPAETAPRASGLGTTPSVADPMGPLRQHATNNIRAGTVLRNEDGSTSTVRSGSVSDQRLNGGRPTLIPFIWEGKLVSQKEAVRRAVESGQQWPAFDSNEAATVASKGLSESIQPPQQRRPEAGLSQEPEAPVLEEGATAEAGPRMIQVGTMPDGTPRMKVANEGPDLADRTLGAVSGLLGRTATAGKAVTLDVVGGKPLGTAIGERGRQIADLAGETKDAGADILAAGKDLAKQTGDALVTSTAKFAADVRRGFGKLPQSVAANKAPNVDISEVKEEDVEKLTWDAFNAAGEVQESLDAADAQAKTPEEQRALAAERGRLGNTGINLAVPSTTGKLNMRQVTRGLSLMINAGTITPVQAVEILRSRVNDVREHARLDATARTKAGKSEAEERLANQRYNNAVLDGWTKEQALVKGTREQYKAVAESAMPALKMAFMASSLRLVDDRVNIGGQEWQMEDLLAVAHEGLYQDGAATGIDLAEVQNRGHFTQAELGIVTSLGVKYFQNLAKNKAAKPGLFGKAGVNNTLDPVSADGQLLTVKTPDGQEEVPIAEFIEELRNRFKNDPAMATQTDAEIMATVRRSPAKYDVINR